MIKESEKSINIENIDNKGGTINFYVNDEKDENPKTVPIAAVDKNSTPLEGYVEISPWGDDLHKLSFRLTEKLNNQTIYQKYLIFKEEDKAKEVRAKVLDVFHEIQTDATKRRKVSGFLIPKAHNLLSNLSEEADIGYNDVIDNSITLRFDNNQFDTHRRDDPRPYGWVGEEPRSTYTQGVAPNIAEIVGVPTQYSNPGRTGVMAASKDNMNIKTASKSHKVSSNIKRLYDTQELSQKKNLPISKNILYLYADLEKEAEYSAGEVSNFSLDELYSFFKDNRWSWQYGGEAWANIVKSLIELKEAKGAKVIVLIDHIVDIHHNTGTVFNKNNELNKIIQNVIKIKTDNISFMDVYKGFYSHFSSEVKYLYKKFINYGKIFYNVSRTSGYPIYEDRRNESFLSDSYDSHSFYDFYGLSMLSSVVEQYGTDFDKKEFNDIYNGVINKVKDIFIEYLTYAVYREARHFDKVSGSIEEDLAKRDAINISQYMKKDVIVDNLEERMEQIKKFPVASYYLAANMQKRIPELENTIAKNSKYACEYAKNIIMDRWPLGEPAIVADPYAAADYASKVIKGPWPEAEDTIAKDAYTSLSYALNALEGNRFPKGEAIIASVIDTMFQYAEEVIGGSFPEGEKMLLEYGDGYYIQKYARNIIHGRWPEAEEYFLNNLSHDTLDYFENVFNKNGTKRRWYELEDKITENIYINENWNQQYLAVMYCKIIEMRIAKFEKALLEKGKYQPSNLTEYARDVINKPWPEAESIIAQDANSAYSYANFLGERFPKGEYEIFNNVLYSKMYNYINNFVNERDSHIENIIVDTNINKSHLTDATIIYWDKFFKEEQWPQLEQRIFNMPILAMQYMEKVKNKGRWPEAEPYLTTRSDFALRYALITNTRFFAAEENILRYKYNAIDYLQYIIKDKRWPEFESIYIYDSDDVNAKNTYFDYLFNNKIMNPYEMIKEFPSEEKFIQNKFSNYFKDEDLQENEENKWETKQDSEGNDYYVTDPDTFFEQKRQRVSNNIINLIRKEGTIMSKTNLSNTICNLFNVLSSKKFTTEEAKSIAHKIGIRWDVVDFKVEDFKKGLNVEVEHDDDPQTDVVRDDDEKWESVGKIAWRHLKESPDYYKELDKMEKKFKD